MESGNASENTIGEVQTVVPAAETTVEGTRKVAEKRKSRRGPTKGRVSKKIKQEDEDVCFVCLNGGDLVLCDFKCCPKAYHLACIQKEEDFLSSKMRWICGWHLCTCLKSAQYMCYTCTVSYCKKCVKDGEFVCVRKNYGFCGPCLKSVMLIEVQDDGSKEKMEVDFDDEDSWDYLFKSYWIIVKNKMSLTLKELKEGRNAWNDIVGSDFLPPPSEDGVTKTHEHSEPEIVQQACVRTESCGEKSTVVDGCADWGSRELLEFVSLIRNGDTTVMSRSNVQLLLLDYINSNNLHDPNQESQIVCDDKLTNLFGKPFVGHEEMIKLLDFHFMKNGNSPKKAGIHADTDEHKSQTNNQSKASDKKDEDRTPQTNFDDYAAIDVHNISLIFLRRSMIESILGEVENFHEQVVGSIVRITVSNDGQKPDMHRLVQVVGTSKGTETYQVGDKSTDIMLEVLNLTKKESIQINAVSDEDFSEDECKRLHQGIKFGLVKRLAVEEIQSKAVGLQALKFHDWLAAEILRLNRIRNQAKAKGLDKEVIECTEKLKMLKTPEERQRRLSSIPEVHSDPKMNPSYESEDEEEDKDDGPTGDEGLHENENGCVSNICDNIPIGEEGLHENENGHVSNTCDDKQEEDNASGWSVSENEDSGSETAIKVDSPSIYISEMEDVWRYRDPLDRIQGPFSMKHLRFWSTTGFFPPDMKTWIGDNEEENSILVSDAVAGKFHKVSTDRQKSSELSVGDSNVLDLASPNPETGTQNTEIDSNVLDLASPNPETGTENTEIDSNVLNLASPNPETGTENTEIDSNVLILANPNPETGTENTESDSNVLNLASPNLETGTENTGMDSNVLNLASPNPETGTENTEIVPSSEENPVDMEIQAYDMYMLVGNDLNVSDALAGKFHSVSTDPQKSSELSVEDSNVLDLASPNTETVTENVKTWNGDHEEENSVLVSDALAGKFQKVSTDPKKSSELSVDDSYVLDLASPNPETGTENLDIVPASEEMPVDMEIQANDMNTSVGKDFMISDAPTDFNQSMSSWQGLNECIELPEDVSEILVHDMNTSVGKDFMISNAPTDFNQFMSSWPGINECIELPEDFSEILANDMNTSVGKDFMISDAPTDCNENMFSWQGINDCIEVPEDFSEILAQIDAMGCGGGGATTDVIDFEETGLLEEVMDSVFGNSDGAAANNPPPTESSSSDIQK